MDHEAILKTRASFFKSYIMSKFELTSLVKFPITPMPLKTTFTKQIRN